MSSHATLLLASVAAISIFAASRAASPQPATPQPEPTPEQKAQMAAWEAIAAPGEHHKLLAQLAGDWECKVVSSYSGQPEESKATIRSNLTMGGRYLTGNFRGSMMGKPLNGQLIMGYNNASGKYETVWRDNASTGMMIETGTADAAGKVLTLRGEHAEPGGKTTQSRTVYTIEENKYTVQVFNSGAGGKEDKVFEMTCNRTKLPARATPAERDAEDIQPNVRGRIRREPAKPN